MSDTDNGTADLGTTSTEGSTETGDISDDFSLTLDDLMNADFSEDEIMGTTHKGLPEYQEILKHLPINGRKLISNLRSMATTKTQELAQMRKEVQSERESLIREREALLGGKFKQHIDDLAGKQTEYDPWSEEGIQAKIQTESAKMFQQMLAPMTAELEAAKRGSQLEAFKSQNPDLITYRDDIAKLLMSRDDLRLEDAYYIVKGQAAASASGIARDAAKSRVASVSKTSTGNNIANTTVPKFGSAWEAYSYFKDNPEASKTVNKIGNKKR
jgi:hypothetical protein